MKKMYRPSTKAQFLGKSRQPIEGLFCAYTHRKCMQNRLEGYEYCLKHILEDKNAPFKQCSYTSSKSAKRCTNASSKSDRKEGYCLEHSRRAVLIRQRVSRKKRPKETPETLLEDLEPYAGIGRQYVEHDHKRGHGATSKALEYASSSDSDAETPVVDQAWKGDDDSDAESVDSEQEDLLKHAGVYTAEEVALIMRDKLIRLQSLYIDQFKRLQHVMREKRRKYLHTHQPEQEKLGGMGQYVKDTNQRDNWNRLSAMKRYHKRFGAEALLHRQSKQRRIAVSEGASYKPPSYPRCIHDTGDGRCTAHAVPLSKFCLNHILQDPHQVLYQPCSFGGGDCSRPVATLDDGPPHCPLHTVLGEQQTSEQANDAEDNDTEDSTVDMTLDVTMDTSSSLATAEAGLPTVGTSSQSGDISENNDPQELDPATQEALMKKGRLLLRHLQTLDAQMTQAAGSPTQPSGSRSAPSQLNFNPFIFLTQPQNVVQPQSTVQMQNTIQSQRTVQIQGTGKLKTVSQAQQRPTVGLNVVQHTGKVENIGKLQISTQIQTVGQSHGITQSQNNGKLQSIGPPQSTGQPQCTGQPHSSQLQIPGKPQSSQLQIQVQPQISQLQIPVQPQSSQLQIAVQPQSSQLQSTGQLQNTEQQNTGESQSSSEIVELQTRESLLNTGQPQPSMAPQTTGRSENAAELLVVDVPQSRASYEGQSSSAVQSNGVLGETVDQPS